jgi:hypothetical protein
VRGRRFLVSALPVVAALLLATAPDPPVGHSTPSPQASPSDPVARLQARLDAGEAQLEFDPVRGYLPSLLDELGIAVSTQGLVFSRTSLQTDRVAPWNPRAVYFSDDVYVGWVPESPLLEVAAIDPLEGVVFYSLDQDPEGPPAFRRETTTCLMCHESAVTGGAPGLIVRSVLTDRMGYPIVNVHEGSTTDRTPIADRWGGWYVTGSHAGRDHAGNLLAPVLSHEVPDRRSFLRQFDRSGSGAVMDLQGRFDLAPYPIPDSDMVALMVLTHQAQVHNLIAAVHAEAREALRFQAMAASRPGATEGPEDLPAGARARLDASVERLVRALLFVGEAPLEGPVKGTSSFVGDFESSGVRDGRGRSLRELELETRLFRYPLSFMVGSDAFLALPRVAKDTAYRRIREVLGGEDRSEPFRHLDDSLRQALLEILRETHPEFAVSR